MADLNQFAEDFRQEVLARATQTDAEMPIGEAFTEAMIEELCGAGVLDDGETAHYRSRGMEVSGYNVSEDGENLDLFVKAVAEFQAAQDQLSSALGRLLAVAEAYPQLRANENFLALQSQLEGTENRIAVERRRYNDAARAFNTRRDSFPTVVIAGAFGERFAEKPYFAAQAGAAEAPKVKF